MRYRHTMLHVRDMSRAIDFYRQAAGFRLKSQHRFVDPPLSITFMLAPEDDDSGPSLELVQDPRVALSECTVARGHVSYLVKDLRSLTDRVQLFGGRLLQQPTKTLDGRALLAIFADPDGNEIELIQAFDTEGKAK